MKSNSYCIDIIREYLLKNTNFEIHNINYEELKIIFQKLAISNDFNNLYLRNYLYSNVCSDDVMKRKTSARDFEDFISSLLNGQVTDEKNRKNTVTIQLENEYITNWSASNHREKVDVYFPNGYALSVKTLIQSNKEINMGAFEKTALFYNLQVEDYLSERKGKNAIGLGSIPQLTELLKVIEKNNQFELFCKRFIEMSRVIFAHDIVLLIKNDIKSELLLIKKEKFIDKLKIIATSPENFTSFVNRWEGNSIRLKTSGLREIADIISFDMDFKNNQLILSINHFEHEINKIIISFGNEKQELRSQIKENLLTQSEKLFSVIEQFCHSN